MTDAGSPPTVLATGTYDADSHPRVRVMIQGLEAHGWAVEEIVEPLGIGTSQRVDLLRYPRLLPLLALALARAWSRLGVRLVRRRRRGPRPTAVLIGYLGHFDIGLVRRLTRPVPVVLDFLISGATTADDRGVSGRGRRRLLVALDTFALRRADVVVVDTQEHAQALPDWARPRAVVVPVGADERWFEAGRDRDPERAIGTRLSVVFFGLFTPLQGTRVIAEALRELDGAVDATIIGTGQDEAAVDEILAGVPGVTRMTWVQSDELPALVAQHDVCLGIFGTSQKARSVVPNKAFQGAAAGCVVVTSGTTPQRHMLGETAVYVPPGDAAALAAALRTLADDRASLDGLTAISVAHARASLSPSASVSPLVAVLERYR